MVLDEEKNEAEAEVKEQSKEKALALDTQDLKGGGDDDEDEVEDTQNTDEKQEPEVVSGFEGAETLEFKNRDFDLKLSSAHIPLNALVGYFHWMVSQNELKSFFTNHKSKRQNNYTF